MPKGHCKGWSPGNVSKGQHKAADTRMDKHVAKYPKCSDADVCVHSGWLFSSAHCCGCGRGI